MLNNHLLHNTFMVALRVAEFRGIGVLDCKYGVGSERERERESIAPSLKIRDSLRVRRDTLIMALIHPRS